MIFKKSLTTSTVLKDKTFFFLFSTCKILFKKEKTEIFRHDDKGKLGIIMPLLQTLKNMKSQAMTKQNYFNT